MTPANRLIACIAMLVACRNSDKKESHGAAEASNPGLTPGAPAASAADDGSPSPRAAVPAPDALPSTASGLPSDAGSAAASVVFPADWCSRAPVDIGDRYDFIGDISDNYYDKQSRDCRTTGLTQFASDPVLGSAWLDYLFGYTNAMVGCPFLLEPVVDGIRAFGPANTAAIGVTRPALGRDDAQLLIELYVAEFSRVLRLTADESAAVEVYLWQWATPQVDPTTSATLSRCDDRAAAPSD